MLAQVRLRVFVQPGAKPVTDEQVRRYLEVNPDQIRELEVLGDLKVISS